MKRLYLAAVAGLCAVVPVGAQERALAPTAPVVPPPSLHNGSLVAPAGAWGGGGGMLSRSSWAPGRELAGTSDRAYLGAVAGVPCGPAGCGTAEPRRSCLERIKSWLCFQYTPTELPKMRPTPYVTPIQGLLGCSSGAGCAPCGTTGGGYPSGQPVPQPTPLPVPMKPPAGAGAVLMPSRGTQWMIAPTEFGTAKTTTAQGAPGPVVNTGYRAPQR
ncbi:hypothetical protein R5W23_006200 [Gemmata sp. JC673]|uniref:Uncharacterized protein n=1 Tax=Gemmata algarum TaxID=2975278 RepID=A0ABU5EV14_9BACT|nr:hypothetical protein [Gemmata algarum]MDY3559010.1 hypothetical protein [Gemmata algarum]